MISDTSNIVIQATNVGKCYRIGLKEDMHGDLSVAFYEFLKSPLKNYRKYRSLYRFDDVDPNSDENGSGDPADILWALRGVDFQVQRGEVLGVVGRNGAGKSTLLKILSKITSPTTGRVSIRGKVASLLATLSSMTLPPTRTTTPPKISGSTANSNFNRFP